MLQRPFPFPNAAPPHQILSPDSQSFIIADELNHRVVKTDADGNELWSTPKEGPGALKYPCGLLLQDDKIWVADSWNHRVAVFDGNGSFLSGFGHLGTGPGAFENPVYLSPGEDGGVWVLDSGNHRLQLISKDGTSVKVVEGGSQAQKEAMLNPYRCASRHANDMSIPQRLPLYYPRSLIVGPGYRIILSAKELLVLAAGQVALAPQYLYLGEMCPIAAYEDGILLLERHRHQLVGFHLETGSLHQLAQLKKPVFAACTTQDGFALFDGSQCYHLETQANSLHQLAGLFAEYPETESGAAFWFQSPVARWKSCLSGIAEVLGETPAPRRLNNHQTYQQLMLQSMGPGASIQARIMQRLSLEKHTGGNVAERLEDTKISLKTIALLEAQLETVLKDMVVPDWHEPMPDEQAIKSFHYKAWILRTAIWEITQHLQDIWREASGEDRTKGLEVLQDLQQGSQNDGTLGFAPRLVSLIKGEDPPPAPVLWRVFPYGMPAAAFAQARIWEDLAAICVPTLPNCIPNLEFWEFAQKQERWWGDDPTQRRTVFYEDVDVRAGMAMRIVMRKFHDPPREEPFPFYKIPLQEVLDWEKHTYAAFFRELHQNTAETQRAGYCNWPLELLASDTEAFVAMTFKTYGVSLSTRRIAMLAKLIRLDIVGAQVHGIREGYPWMNPVQFREKIPQEMWQDIDTFFTSLGY